MMSVTQVDFERSVHRGLGRAVQWLLSGAVTPDRDFLLYACTHNLAYDRQCEDNRALYMQDIIQATGELNFYVRAVERTLTAWEGNEEDENLVSIYQMFDFLGLLAKNGDASARRSLYSFFERNVQSNAVREEVLVELDGLNGFLFVIQQWSQHPQPEDDNQRFDYLLLDKVETQFGQENVRAFLEQAAHDNPAIGAYLADVREKHAAWQTRLKSRPERHWPDYAELRNLIFDTKKRYGPMVWARYGEHLPDADAEKMAWELLSETDPKRLARYLLLFKRHPFPLNHAPLLALARSAEQEIATAARAVLAQIEQLSVRALALELLETSLRPWELVAMLTKNYCPGDEQAIERVLSKTWDADDMHRLTLDVRDLVEANPQPAFAAVLMRLYEEGYCTMCRYGVIELLAELGPLPPVLVEECRYDAYADIRELVQAKKAAKSKAESRHGF